MNTTGTKRLLNICHNMPNLLAIIHLSTAFCYCDQEVLLEKVYDCPHNPEDLIRCAEWMDLKTLEKITPDLLSPHPNTYTYSKRLAEILVQKEYPSLPVAITRPSIGKLTMTWSLFCNFSIECIWHLFFMRSWWEQGVLLTSIHVRWQLESSQLMFSTQSNWSFIVWTTSKQQQQQYTYVKFLINPPRCFCCRCRCCCCCFGCCCCRCCWCCLIQTLIMIIDLN